MPEFVQLEPGGEFPGRVPAVLDGGGLIALGSAGKYRVLGRALHPRACQRLCSLVGLQSRPALVLSQSREIWDWLPGGRGSVLRLIRRFWPGPLALLAQDGFAEGLWRGLPGFVHDLCHESGGLPLTVADSPLAADLTATAAGPLIQGETQAELNLTDRAATNWGEQFDLIIDMPAAEPITWVSAQGGKWRLLYPGILSQAELEEAARCRIVFVCTGNTCRSPLAAALCRVLLSRHLACTEADLERRGFVVQSAGLAAMAGGPATPEAVAVAESHGGQLENHRSRPLNLDMVANADQLLTMTRSHLTLLESLNLEVGPRPKLLSPRGDDVDDPIGGGQGIYQACAAQILEALRERLPEFLES